MTDKTVLILGGGVGGIVTANTVRELLGSEHRVIMVEKRTEHVFTPSLLWVMVGWRQPNQIVKDLHHMLSPGVELALAEALEIDPGGQKVRTSNGDFSYDYLVLALGAALAPEVTPGFDESAHTPYSLDGAARLWSTLRHFEGGRVAVLVAAMPYKCPAAPYETALLLDDQLRKQGIRDRCEVEVYTPEVLPMGVAGPAMGQAVVGMLETKGIRFNPNLDLLNIDSERKELIFSSREPAPFDLLAGVPAHRPPQVVRQTGLADDGGWVPVNRRTLQTSHENIYAVGDVTAVTLANGKPLPKAAIFAEGQARTVASSIAAAVQGSGEQAEFDGVGFCWIETGSGSAGFASGEFYAEPDPIVPLPHSGRMWHWGKILFEKYWLSTGITRGVSELGLNLGSKILGIPASF